jgi:hypothetical protein
VEISQPFKALPLAQKDGDPTLRCTTDSWEACSYVKGERLIARMA